MNLIFSTVIIYFYLAAPGLTFLKNYYSYELNHQEISFNNQQKLLVTLLPGLIIHSIFYYMSAFFLEKAGFVSCDFYKLGILLSPQSSGAFAEAFSSLKPYLGGIASYTFGLMIFSLILGRSLRKTENYLRNRFARVEVFMSRRSRFNIWNEIFYVPPVLTEKQIYLLLVHVVTEVDGKAIIYKGILERYEVTEKGGDLKCVVLRYVKKKAFGSGKSGNEGVVITNDSQEQLLIPFSNIINLKVKKIKINLAGNFQTAPAVERP